MIKEKENEDISLKEKNTDTPEKVKVTSNEKKENVKKQHKEKPKANLKKEDLELTKEKMSEIKKELKNKKITENKPENVSTENKEKRNNISTQNKEKQKNVSTQNKEKQNNISTQNNEKKTQKNNTYKNKEQTIVKEEEKKHFNQIPNDQEKKSSHHWIFAIGIFFIIFIVLILIIFGGFTIYNFINNQKISKGIYINSIEMSGLTKEEAKSKLNDYYSDKLSNDITLVHGDFNSYLKTSEINLTFDVDSAVNYAYNIGKTNNIFKDNYQIFNAMINEINITPTYSFDENALTKILTDLSGEFPDAVVEGAYYIEDKSLIITKGTAGSIIDIEPTIKLIKSKIDDLSFLNETIELQVVTQNPKEIDLNAIYNEVHTEAQDAYYTTNPFKVYPSANGIDFKVSLEEAQNILNSSEGECTIPLKVLYPKVTTNMIGQEAFPDLLATFSTNYAASNTNRTTNLRLAAGKINGYVLLPGETFSYNAVVGKRTIAAGYKEAAVYENGQVVQGLGGGICQISSTLFNAVLFANLEIVELHNHQFVPSYVKAGRDATVVYGVKDFQFKNSRNNAVKINCSVANGVATFNIWGVKEPNEYDVSVYSNINSQTASYIKSSTYRTLKQNGAVIKTENVMNATYKVH